MLYKYQKKAIAQVHKLFETVKKVCLAVSCSGGKTIMAISISNDFIISNPKVKILILTHGQVLLRQQFNAECQQYEERVGKLSTTFKNAAVEKSSELKKLYPNNNVLITIPQTIKNLKKLPKFDIVIVDEAHQFYSANMVSKIIKSCKADKELVLTGTPSYFIRHKWPIVPVSMGSLYPEFIQDFIIELAYSSSYVMGDSDYDYNRGEISKNSERKVLTKKGTRDTLDGLLDFIHKRAKMIWKRFPSVANALIKFPDWIVASKKLEKTMIACQSQVQAKYVQEYFEEKGINTLLSISELEGASESIKTFNEFKVNDEIKILIVVGRGILGFNYPDLVNVFDLTCSTNVERIFQLMSRVTRKSGKRCQKLFLKVAPDLNIGLKGKDYFNYIMSAVLSLTDDYWFINFDGKNMLKLRIPRLPSLSGKRGSKSGTPKKSMFINLQNFIGLPALKFFRDLKKKFNDDHYSYAYTTLGIVRHELGISKDLETASNERTIKVCEWVIKNKKQPYSKSKDKTETSYAGFIGSKKEARYGNKNWAWYDSDQEIATSFGLPDLFSKVDLEKESNEMTIALCNWIKNNGRLPKQDSKDEEEKRYHSFLSNRKLIRKGSSNGVWYVSDQKIAKSFGFPKLFDNEDKERYSNGLTTELCKWIKNKRRLPNPKNKDEKKMYSFIHTRKEAKRGKKGSIWYDSDQKIVESFGLSDIFDYADLEKISNNKTIKLCKWVRSKGSYPSQVSEDEDEKDLARFYYSRISAKNNKGKNKWYESDQEIAVKNGFPHLFDNSRERRSNDRVNAVCKWIVDNKRYPSQSSKDDNECKHALFITCKRAAYNNSLRKKPKKGMHTWYDSDQKIAERYNLSDLFIRKE